MELDDKKLGKRWFLEESIKYVVITVFLINGENKNIKYCEIKEKIKLLVKICRKYPT